MPVSFRPMQSRAEPTASRLLTLASWADSAPLVEGDASLLQTGSTRLILLMLQTGKERQAVTVFQTDSWEKKKKKSHKAKCSLGQSILMGKLKVNQLNEERMWLRVYCLSECWA